VTTSLIAAGLRKIIDDMNTAIENNVVVFDKTNSEESVADLTAERQIIRSLEELFDENRDPNNPFDPEIDSDEKIAPTRDELEACIEALSQEKEERKKGHPFTEEKFFDAEGAVYDDVIAKLTELRDTNSWGPA
jgi:hypothetical protein